MTNRLFMATAIAAGAIWPITSQADILEARSPATIYLSPTGAVTTVVNLALPLAGQYRAVGKVALSNRTGVEDYTRCGIALDGVTIDSSVTVIGGPNAPIVATDVTEAKVATTTPNHTVSLLCNHDHYLDGIYAYPGASLEVIAVPAGAKGDTGLAGIRGDTGPAGEATFALCNGVNPVNPTNPGCSCGSAKLISYTSAAGVCTAVTQSGTCTASGYGVSVGGISNTYLASCCACGTSL